MSKEKSSSSGILKVLLASVLSLGLGAGGYWFYEHNVANASVGPNQASPEAAPVRMEPAAMPVFLDLEPFTLTLQDQISSRVLYVGLTIQLKDEASRDRLNRYMPIVRSRIITELSDIRPSMLNERDTKSAIRSTVSKTLELPFTSEAQQQHIADVLFSAFVVQ
jgi:flagellar FliL protein